MRFEVVETIVSKGGGAVALLCHVLDTELEGQTEYVSTDFNRDENRYVRKKISGQFVGLSFPRRIHADCMAAALNAGLEMIHREENATGARWDA